MVFKQLFLVWILNVSVAIFIKSFAIQSLIPIAGVVIKEKLAGTIRYHSQSIAAYRSCPIYFITLEYSRSR